MWEAQHMLLFGNGWPSTMDLSSGDGPPHEMGGLLVDLWWSSARVWSEN